MFTGTLKTFSVTNLMQMCYNDNNTGTVEFTKNNTSCARMGFSNGRLMYAKLLGIEGIEAVKQLTLLQDLNFNFTPQAPQMGANIKTDINFLLLDCSRYMDECVEYIGRLKNLFPAKYALKGARFYQYAHNYFASYDLYHVKYFEVYDQTDMTVIYQDKNIGARIEILFENKILTNDLLMFMDEKDIF
ncbi:MAG: DUF4388 domain-containing protein [Desulfobacteraceae bacterium]|nr:DUF4388 domain-containing protein [Desulfobacteraceae bacterium]